MRELRRADIIYAVDRSTGERCGLFFGDPAAESLPRYRLAPWDAPAVVQVSVDRASDDREVLAVAVERIKGSCCYVGDLRETLIEPLAVLDLRLADFIYAVDAATGERCRLLFGDPATESVPCHALLPWDVPAVVEVRVNPASDDLEVLAEAVRRIKGWCRESPDGEGLGR